MRGLKRPLLLLAQYLRPLWPQVLLLTLLLFAGIGVQLINPQIIRFFIDTAESGGSQQALFVAALLFLAFALARQILAVITTIVGERMGWVATNQLRADLALHCLRLDMSFHGQHAPGELIDRIDGDVTMLANFFSQLVIQVLGNLLLAGGILLLLFMEDGRFGIIGLLYVSVLFLFLRAVHKPTVGFWGAARSAQAELFGFLEERLTGTEDIRANGAESYAMKRLVQLNGDLLRKQRTAAVMGSTTFVSGWGLYVLSYIAAFALGVALYLNGSITLGTVYLVVYYLGSLETPLNEIRRQVTDLQRAGASIQRIDGLFSIEPHISDPVDARRPLPDGALGVNFDRVSFAYDEREQVLADVSFALQPGHVLGLLGRTGSGKTTLTRLLFRLYDPCSGEIRLNGTRIAELNLSDLRRRVGLVTQDVQLFAATVRDNITFFSRRFSDQDLLGVMDQLGLSEWLHALPAGLDTPLGAGGKGLSAGEAQLLAFARVFLRAPGIVILDEASSRLDPATEQLIERAVDRLLIDRTGLVIAHRLSTVQRADEILILDAGRVGEYGSRQQLAVDPASRFSALLRSGLEEVLV